MTVGYKYGSVLPPHPLAPQQRWVRGSANGERKGVGSRESEVGACPSPTPYSLFAIPSAFCQLLFAICLLPFFSLGEALSQVSPAEIRGPQLKAAEQKYLPALQSLRRAIASAQFPFPFVVSRYVGLDPKSQPGADTRGIEFVKFHDRVVLKISGNYNAAYNADKLTQNQRADRVFNDVVVPILRLLPQEIPPDVACDAIGFEISYHVQSGRRNYEYEGKEILTIVLVKADASAFLSLGRDSDRQDVLNRSEIYVSGKEFGLALGERNPFRPEDVDRAALHQRGSLDSAASSSSGSDNRLSRIGEDLPPALPKSAAHAGGASADPSARASGRQADPRLTVSGANTSVAADREAAEGGQGSLERTPPDCVGTGSALGQPPQHNAERQAATPTAATQADADRLHAKYQPQLETLGKEGQFHFAEYAPPDFVVFRHQIFLQLTLRNLQAFNKEDSSIYKRAAQSFDLFLAPQLKALLARVPADPELQGLDLTVLNQLPAKTQSSSEAIEFICPLKPLSQFAEAEITNQDLINQSTVLVNGVRIALNLQQVE